MLDPIIREKYIAAIKSALLKSGLTIAEAGRRTGKGASWLTGVMTRVREGQTLTAESVRLLRTHVSTLEEDLRAAGWTASGVPSRNRPAIITRNSQVLRQHLNQILLRYEELGREIITIREQIEEVEVR